MARVGVPRAGGDRAAMGWHDAPGQCGSAARHTDIRGWDRTSARRRKVPLTTVASAKPWQRALGDRSCSGGVPARRTDRGLLLGRARAANEGKSKWSGGHLGPPEPGELPGDGGGDALGVLASGQDAEAATPALLCRPRARDHLGIQALVMVGDLPANRGTVLVGPGRLDQCARRWALPALVSRPRWTVLPLEYSLGTSPQNPMNWLAWATRRHSAAKVSAPSRVTPR